MPCTHEGRNQATRQAYAKPTVVAIELKAEEVLGVGCKQDPSAMPNYNQPTSCGVASSCALGGS